MRREGFSRPQSATVAVYTGCRKIHRAFFRSFTKDLKSTSFFQSKFGAPVTIIREFLICIKPFFWAIQDARDSVFEDSVCFIRMKNWWFLMEEFLLEKLIFIFDVYVNSTLLFLNLGYLALSCDMPLFVK